MRSKPADGLKLFASGILLFASAAPGEEAAHGPMAVCATDFDCFSAAEPFCDAGTCTAGPASCVGDDAADTGGATDDGPAAGRDLSGATGVPVQLAGAVCNAPPREADFYRATVAAGNGLQLALSWSGDANLDLEAFDDSGARIGLARYGSPETIALTILPAGTYFFSVARVASAGDATPVAYTISATKTAALVCTGDHECDDEFGNQTFRSECAAGVCEFRAGSGQAAGTACDRDGNCGSGLCSHVAFEADAGDAVCTLDCASDLDCAGLGAGYACSAGLQPNRCLPSCSTDLECGADIASSSPDPGRPWNYYSCDAGSGRCSYWIFADGVEIGDSCSWSGSAPVSSCP